MSERGFIRGTLICFALSILFGCVSKTTIRYVDMSPPATSAEPIDEVELLDVGVAVFEANVPDDFDARVELNISPEIREAEANYLAFFLKDLLQSTGNWGAVRVIPRLSHAVDVTVEGKIIHSDGERLIVAIKVTDARGDVWFDEIYETLASKYAYESELPKSIDPFQTTYKQVANEMLKHFSALSDVERQEIRTTAELRFAKSFSAEAFSDHIAMSEKKGTYEITRLPAEDDPMLERIRKIREREYLFIDTLDEYFLNFSDKMYKPYQNWRQGSYKDAIAFREARNKVRARLFAGTAMIVSGAAMQRSSSNLTEYTGYANVIGGAGYVLGGIKSRTRMDEHAGALRELGISASAEISPYTIELENATFSLMGSVDEQYDSLRKILKRLYYEDFGLDPPAELVAGDDVSSTTTLSAIHAVEELEASLELQDVGESE